MSPLLNFMFGNSLENLGKKHRRVQKQTLRQVSEIFENLQKSSKSSENRKMSQSAQDDLPAFSNFFLMNLRKSSEVYGCLRKSSEIFGNFRKVLFKNNLQAFLIFSQLNLRNCRKSSEVFGKCRKVHKTIFHNIEMLGKLRKPSENFRI